MPVSSSASRTPVAEAAGRADPADLDGRAAALAIGVRLVARPALLADLPTAALAAVVIAAGLSLVDV